MAPCVRPACSSAPHSASKGSAAALVGVELDALRQLAKERPVGDGAAQRGVRLQGEVGFANGHGQQPGVGLLARGHDVRLGVVGEQLLAQVPDAAQVVEVFESRGDDAIQVFALHDGARARNVHRHTP
jgi:hypothetical protein